jgi:hypothetical protein
MRTSLVLMVFVVTLAATHARAESRDQLANAALAHAGLGAIDGLAARARWAALVPDVRFDVRRGLGQGLSGQPIDTYDAWSRVSLDQSLSFGVTLAFELSRVVFAPEEPTLLRMQETAAESRLRILDHVLTRYDELCDALSARDSRAATRLRIELESLTGSRLRAAPRDLECGARESSRTGD